MSTIDNRVVRMQFDNAQFEAGVMKSMDTLDKLNEKLQFKEAGKGISALQVALNGVNFDGMYNGINRMESYITSFTGMVKKKIKEDIVDGIIDAAKKLENATLGQIKSGGWARASNIANAQFTIEGLKYSWDEVRKAADYAVTDTAYGLDVAAKAASQLAASGVDFHEIIGKDGVGNDLTQMHKALRAISGVAAMTNSSYEEISHIFTRVAGQGKVMANDLNSIAARGINAAAELAKQLNVTEAEVRDMVSRGLIDFNTFAMAMDDAYGDHAKEANKTFTGALSNMKAALSRIGAIFAQPVIDKTNTLFISITSRIKEFQSALSDQKNLRLTAQGLKRLSKEANELANKYGYVGEQRTQFINKTIKDNKKALLENEEALKNGDVEQYSISRFATHFAEAWESAIKFASKFVEMLDLSWFQDVGSFLDRTAIKIKNFFDSAAGAVENVQKRVEEATKGISESLNLDIEDLKLLHRILKNEFGYVEERWNALDKIYQEQGSSKTGKWLQSYMDELSTVGYKFEELGWTEEEFRKKEKELAKTQAQRVSEMTAEEVIIETIADKIVYLQQTASHFKTVIGNVFKSIYSGGESAVKIFLQITKGVESAFGLKDIGELLEPISDGFRELVESVSPSTDTLAKFQTTAHNVAATVGEFIRPLAEGAAEAIKFAAACISASESFEEISENSDLTPLQSSVVSVLRVVKNLWTIVTNVGKSIGKIAKAILKAFTKVFNPSGMLSGIADTSEGLANLSEKLLISDEAAEVVEKAFEGLFTVIQGVATVISKIVGGLASFIGISKSTKKETDKVDDSLASVEKTGEKATTVFDNLKTIFDNILKKIKALPDKFNEFKEELEQQEGVQKLKKSLDDLKQKFEETIKNGTNPFKKGIEELADATGGEGETSIGKLANGIGYVSGKIADFIDDLPNKLKKIEDFFDGIKKKVDDTVSKLHIGDFFTSVSNAFDVSTQNKDGSILDKVKTFADELFTSISTYLKDVDWTKVGKTSLLTLVGANLFSFFKITNNLGKTIKNIAGIPAAISGTFSAFKDVLGTAKSSLKKITNAYILVALAQTMVSLVGAIVLLKDIPEEDIKKSLAAMTWVAVIILILSKCVELATRNLFSLNKEVISNSNVVDKAVFNINRSTSKFMGLATVLISVGAAVFLIAKGISALLESLKDADDADIGDTIMFLGIIASGLIAFSILAAAMCWAVKKDWIDVDALYAFGVVMAAMGVAVFLVAEAVKAINGENIKAESLWIVAGIIGAIAVAAFLIGKAAKDVKLTSLVGMAIVIVVLAGVLALVAFELSLLSLEMAAYVAAGNEKAVYMALGSICGVLLALGGAVALMGRGLKHAKNAKELIGIIAAMAVLMLFIGLALSKIFEVTKGNDYGTQAIIVGGMCAMIAVIGLTVGKLLKKLELNKSLLNDEGAKRILALAAVIAAIGAAMYLIGLATEKFEKSITGTEQGNGVLLGFLILAVLVAAVAGMVALLTKKDINVEAISDALLNLAVAFLAIGASVLLIALAAEKLQGLDLTSLTVIGIVIGVIFAALIAMAAFWKKGGFGDNMAAAVNTFLAFSVAVLLLSAAIFVLGLGIGALGTGLGQLAVGISLLAITAEQHKVTFVIVIAIILTVIVLAVVLVKNVTKVAEVVANVASKVAGVVGGVVENIVGKLKDGGKKVSSWWKGKSASFKAGVVSTIVAICGAIVAATPEMLKTIKEVIKKVIYFIIDIIPMLVNGLFDILLRLINSLADVIRKNSTEIAYAIWNVIEAILEVLIDVVMEGISMLTRGAAKLISKIFGKEVDPSDMLAGIEHSTAIMKSKMREGLSYAQDYKDNVEILTEAYGGLDASMNKVADDFAAENGLVKNAAGYYEKIGDAADKASDEVGLFDGKVSDLVASAKEARGFNVSDLVAKATSGGDITELAVDKLGLGASDTFLGGMGQGLTADGVSIPGVDEGTFGELLENSGMDTESINLEGVEDGDYYTSAFAESIDSPDAREEVSTATDNLMGEVEDTIDEHKKELAEEVIPKLMHNLYSSAIVNATDTPYGPGPIKAGDFIAQGLINAINNRLGDVKDTGNDLANAVDEGFVGPLMIKSPSKLFYQNGLYCILGLQNGIKNNEELATDAMTDLSTQMITSFGNPLDYISKVASGEIEYDPSIRPVLDTTSVGRGANAINSMFAGQNLTLNGLTGEIAYDMTNLNNSNASVVSELQALREDMSYMAEEMANMQIVMDTGALVGSTVSAYDRAFGQRELYSGRGN